jgi:putative transposase
MRKVIFQNDGIYHVYNRGVEKRCVFMDDHDYFRFLYGLYDFNDRNSSLNFRYKDSILQSHEVRLREREMVVNIFAFCLMNNHFHLLLQQRTENGITQFMHKLGTGYTNFFNTKYKRVGSLFQGPFKSVAVVHDRQIMHLLHYIHANPLDLCMHEWREKKILQRSKARNILEQYKYSTYGDYIGGNKYPLIINKDFSLSLFGNPEDYKKDMHEWIDDRSFSDISLMILE